MSEPVVNSSERNRFEIDADGQFAVLTYVQHGDVLTLMHTEVPAELEGRGLGGALAKAALEFARENALEVNVRCAFVASYIRRHPEYADLVRAD